MRLSIRFAVLPYVYCFNTNSVSNLYDSMRLLLVDAAVLSTICVNLCLAGDEFPYELFPAFDSFLLHLLVLLADHINDCVSATSCHLSIVRLSSSVLWLNGTS